MKRGPMTHQWKKYEGLRMKCCRTCGVIMTDYTKTAPCSGPRDLTLIQPVKKRKR